MKPFFYLLLSVYFNVVWAQNDITSRFDHDMHMEKVFKPQNIECTRCHAFKVDPETKKIIPEESFEKSTFKKALKTICHECHTGAESQNKNAPKACYTCHRSFEDLKVIKPKNHDNITWKSTHALEARTQGESCTNCHMTSQCAKCHLYRNDIELKAHTRNYLFAHSVLVRASPLRCDACHSKTFCTNCHLGKK